MLDVALGQAWTYLIDGMAAWTVGGILMWAFVTLAVCLALIAVVCVLTS